MDTSHRAARCLHPIAWLLAGCLSAAAHAAPTLGVTDATHLTSSVPVPMDFPVISDGGIGYNVVVDYHSIDGTAVYGTDYVDSGIAVILGNAANPEIPVTLLPNTSTSAPSTFQIQLDGAFAIGPTPAFARQDIQTNSDPTVVVSADINGDGTPDLVIANYGANTVSVMLGTGVPGSTPTYGARQDFSVGPNPLFIAVADLNGDGRPDLVSVGSNGLSILINTTAPGSSTVSFGTQALLTTVQDASSATLADLNNDGKPDLIIPDVSNSRVVVLLNTTAPGAATASFGTAALFTTGVGPLRVVVADFNGDGKPDLAVVDDTTDDVSVLLNTAAAGATTPSFATLQTFSVGRFPQSIAVADFNRDGKPDLIVNNSLDATVSILLNTTATGAAVPSFASQQVVGVGNSPTTVIAADLNNDGIADVVAVNQADDDVSVLVNITAAGASHVTFGPTLTVTTVAEPDFVSAADLNGDGKTELLVAPLNGSQLSVLVNTTPPTTAPASIAGEQDFGTAGFPWGVAVADFNGDGKLDVATVNNSGLGTSNGTVSVLLNTTVPGSAGASFATHAEFTVGIFGFCVVAADINGDGKPDLIVSNNGSNTVSVLLNNAAAGATVPSFAAHQDFTVGSGPEILAVADINGDGRPDIVVANSGAHTISVLLNTTAVGSTTMSFATQQTFATAGPPYGVAIADLNGDGKPDIAVTNQTLSSVSVLLNKTAPGSATASFATHQEFTVGTAPLGIAAIDINGDGKPDLLVTNTVAAAGVYLASVLVNTTAPGATSASFATQQTFEIGEGSRAITAVDLDGDGRPDLLVPSDSENSVSVLFNNTVPGSSTVNFSSRQTFGTDLYPTAVVTADLTGDGKPEIVVPNESYNTISVLPNAQFQVLIGPTTATGTIVHDYLFANGFE
jgi:trimeric autotransporter adhesin